MNRAFRLAPDSSSSIRLPPAELQLRRLNRAKSHKEVRARRDLALSGRGRRRRYLTVMFCDLVPAILRELHYQATAQLGRRDWPGNRNLKVGRASISIRRTEPHRRLVIGYSALLFSDAS